MKKKIFEIFLYGSSLENLEKIGSGYREISYYNKLSSIFNLTVIDYEKYNFHNKSKFDILSKNKNISNLKWSLDFRKCVSKNLKIDKKSIIVSKQFLGSWLGIILKFRYGSKFILRLGYSYSKSKKYDSLLGLVLSPFYYLIECFFILISDGVIFSSHTLKKRYYILTSLRKNIIIPNPYISSFIKKRKHYSKRKTEVIYVGRFNKVKNPSELKNFFNKINLNGLIISNLDTDTSFNKIIIKNKVPNHFIYEYLNNSKYYITFSKSEGSPKSTIEAIACGCIPILSNIEIHNEIIDSLGYGFIVNNHKEAINIIKSKKNNFKIKNYNQFLNEYSEDKGLENFKNFIIN